MHSNQADLLSLSVVKLVFYYEQPSINLFCCHDSYQAVLLSCTVGKLLCCHTVIKLPFIMHSNHAFLKSRTAIKLGFSLKLVIQLLCYHARSSNCSVIMHSHRTVLFCYHIKSSNCSVIMYSHPAAARNHTYH